MKVKIIKSDKKKWYKDFVGRTFEVVDLAEIRTFKAQSHLCALEEDFAQVAGTYGGMRTIYKKDCQIIKTQQ